MTLKKKTHRASRTRFAKDIVCEFLEPARKSNRVIILASGAPVMPGTSMKTLAFLATKGYWVFLPRYRGTWESSGSFLQKSPTEDILDVVRGVASGFVNLETGIRHRIRNPKIFIIGGSFGGPAALLASRDSRVKKAIVLSPVVDWQKQKSTKEPLEFMEKHLRLVWGNGYRGKKEVWKKLATGRFYSPVHERKSIKGKKLLIIHAKDDDIVPYEPAQSFAKETGATFVPLESGGHFGLRSIPKPRFWNAIQPFLKKA